MIDHAGQQHPADATIRHSWVTTRRLARAQKAYIGTFVIALLMCWSPSQALGYLAPALSLTWYTLQSRSNRALIGALCYLCGWVIVIALYYLFMPAFALPSASLVIITYSSFAAFLMISPRAIAGARLYEKGLFILGVVLLVEAPLGIIQAVYGYTQTGSFYGSNGDYVEGTIHPWLAAELAFSNPMYAVNVATVLIMMVPTVFLRGRKIWLFLLGSLALILASVLHVLYFAGIAAIVAVLFIYPSIFRRRLGVLLIIFTLIFATITLNLVGIRYQTAFNFLTHTAAGRTPRGVVIEHAFNGIPAEYELMPLFGIGPGQFSSRAGLIGTGLYFGRPERPRTIPFLPTSMSPAFRDYVIDPWLNMPRPRGLTGSSVQPFFSWLSVYVEFGAIVSAAVLLAVILALIRIRRLAWTFPLRIHGIALATNILLLFLLGMQENYWEVSQAIYVGVLLIILQWSQLIYLKNELSLAQQNTQPQKC